MRKEIQSPGSQAQPGEASLLGELPAAEGSAEVCHLLLIPRRRMEEAKRPEVTRELAGLLAKAGCCGRWLRILRPSVDWIDQDLSVDDFTAPAELLPV